ncbi:hypothetical protein IJ531_03325, partial [bacterium]|nr:hypothetical protein [bacterium]
VFCKYMSGNTQKIHPRQLRALDENIQSIIEQLKEKQSGEVVDFIIDEIKKDRNFNVVKLFNHGDNLTSYFTPKQIKRIAKAYRNKTETPLKVVSHESPLYGERRIYRGTIFYENNNFIINTANSTSSTGYTSTHIYLQHQFQDGTQGKGEMQVRGLLVDEFAQAEHILYKIRSGKYESGNTEYKKIYDILNSLDYISSKKYNSYLKEVYIALRLRELGIMVSIPEIGKGYTDNNGQVVNENDIEELSYASLLKLNVSQ